MKTELSVKSTIFKDDLMKLALKLLRSTGATEMIM